MGDLGAAAIVLTMQTPKKHKSTAEKNEEEEGEAIVARKVSAVGKRGRAQGV